MPLLWHFCLIILGFFTERGYTENDFRQVLPDRNCVHYEDAGAHSLHCEGKIRIFSILFKAINIPPSKATVTITCEDQLVSNPYKYLKLLDLQGYTDIWLQIVGCAPPEDGFSFLQTRKGENVSFIGEEYQSFTLNLICFNDTKISLRKHHFRKLGNMENLRIDCPGLSLMDDDIFSDINVRIIDIEIKNTSLTRTPAVLPLENLEILTICDNLLSEIPSLEKSVNLAQFDVSNNKIEFLNENTFETTKNLKFVFLNNNRLSRLPVSLLGLTQLELLKAHGNRLRVVNLNCLATLPKIRRIDLKENYLQQLDPQTTKFQSVSNKSENAESDGSIALNENCPASRRSDDGEGISFSARNPSCAWLRGNRLILKNNSITEIPERIFKQLENLETIDFSFNTISNLPSNIFHTSKCLKELNLSNNNISSVSETLLANNTKLQALNLSNNQISSLGANFFSGLSQLKSIDLSNNLISTLPDNIFFAFNTSEDKNKKEQFVLNLNGNLLSSLPPLVLPHLSELRVGHNRLVQLPADTFRHTLLLQRIDLSNNLIEHVEPQGDSPDEGGALFHEGLQNLAVVDLSHNRLTGIATVLTLRENIKHLNLQGNQFSDYLKVFHEDGRYPGNVMRSLQFLDMSKNSMAALCNIPRQESSPPHFQYPRLRAMKHQDLSWNRLTLSMSYNDTKIKKKFHLTSSKGPCDWFLKHMPGLEVLILSNNEIDVIPEYIRYLSKLRQLDLSHNKIHAIQFQDFFYVDGLTKRMVNMLGDSEWSYVRKKDYFELPNSHNLTVDLKYNEITSVELPLSKMQIVRGGPDDSEPVFSKATMLLGNNPIVCSCQVLQLLQYYQREARPVSETEKWNKEKLMLAATIDLQDLTCSSPPTVRGKNVSEPETWMHHLLPLCGLCHVLEYSGQ